jgi:hypothetical protein
VLSVFFFVLGGRALGCAAEGACSTRLRAGRSWCRLGCGWPKELVYALGCGWPKELVTLGCGCEDGVLASAGVAKEVVLKLLFTFLHG